MRRMAQRRRSVAQRGVAPLFNMVPRQHMSMKGVTPPAALSQTNVTSF